MIAAGANEEVEKAWELAPSTTAQAAIGMRELPEGDVDRMKIRTHQFAKRQETWMRKLEHATILDVSDRSHESVADQIVELLGRDPAA
jgi:tRNA dimethylallyltransferase